MKYKRTVPVETYVTVDIDLEDIDTDDLVEELESRGRIVEGNNIEQLMTIHQLRRTGKSYDYELEKYISDVLGVVV